MQFCNFGGGLVPVGTVGEPGIVFLIQGIQPGHRDGNRGGVQLETCHGGGGIAGFIVNVFHQTALVLLHGSIQPVMLGAPGQFVSRKAESSFRVFQQCVFVLANAFPVLAFHTVVEQVQSGPVAVQPVQKCHGLIGIGTVCRDAQKIPGCVIHRNGSGGTIFHGKGAVISPETHFCVWDGLTQLLLDLSRTAAAQRSLIGGGYTCQKIGFSVGFQQVVRIAVIIVFGVEQKVFVQKIAGVVRFRKAGKTGGVIPGKDNVQHPGTVGRKHDFCRIIPETPSVHIQNIVCPHGDLGQVCHIESPATQSQGLILALSLQCLPESGHLLPGGDGVKPQIQFLQKVFSVKNPGYVIVGVGEGDTVYLPVDAVGIQIFLGESLLQGRIIGIIEIGIQILVAVALGLTYQGEPLGVEYQIIILMGGQAAGQLLGIVCGVQQGDVQFPAVIVVHLGIQFFQDPVQAGGAASQQQFESYCLGFAFGRPGGAGAACQTAQSKKSSRASDETLIHELPPLFYRWSRRAAARAVQHGRWWRCGLFWP